MKRVSPRHNTGSEDDRPSVLICTPPELDTLIHGVELLISNSEDDAELEWLSDILTCLVTTRQNL